MLIGRVLGSGSLGRWSLILAAEAMLHTLCVNWTHVTTVRYGREEWARSSSPNPTVSTRLQIVGVCVALVVILIAWDPSGWQERWFGIGLADRWLVALCATSSWITAEAQATVQAIDRIAWQSITALILALVAAVIIITLLLLGHIPLSFLALAVTVPLIDGWGCVWMACLKLGVTYLSKPRRALIGQQLAYALPLIPIFGLGYFSDWSDQMLLSRMTTVVEVGNFALSHQLFVVIVAFNGVLTTVPLPKLSAAHVEQTHELWEYLELKVPIICVMWMFAMVWIVDLV